MQVNNENYDIEKLLENVDLEENLLHDCGNGMLLSDKHIAVLKRYDFDYKKYNNINSLLFDIEEYLNDDSDDADDLEWVSSDLAERNYYQNTKK